MTRWRDPSAPSWWQFGLWVIVGPLAVAGLLAAFTPLIVVTAPLTVVVVLGLIYCFGANASMFGIVSGLGAGPLVMAYLNRGGPGSVCATSDTGRSCTDEWSPWPWLVAGLTIVALGVGLYLRLSRPTPGRDRG